jgi:hypothetical protein
MIRDAKQQYDPPLPVSEHWAYICWWRTYSRLLQFSEDPNWVFINYDAMLDGTAAEALCEFAGTQLDFSQVDRGTSRSSTRPWPNSRIALSCRDVYERLRERAAERQRTLPGANLKTIAG